MGESHSSHSLSSHYGKDEFVIRSPNSQALVFAERL